ncbi:hypothetical protein V8D89_002011 [Ganoderma adspersum]
MPPFPALSLLSLFLYITNAVSNQDSVTHDNATVIGHVNETTGTVQYLGIPFAQPPVGPLRLNLPQPVAPYTGTVNATAFGNQCIQLPGTTNLTVPQDEDCLNVNVIVPANVTAGSKLPVVVWIYGGGFEGGSNAVEPVENVISRSVELGHPIIAVSVNYRLSAFGFLGGKEMKEAGVTNLGLHDQRETFRWVQRYISTFGGDPTRVTIWGQSAGAISVAAHMLHNDGDTDGLFRAAFMQSGAPIPTGEVDDALCQPTFDQIVAGAGCARGDDAVACLRNVSVDVFSQALENTAAQSTYFTNSPWLPRADGTFLALPPQRQLLAGRIADIPFVSGNDLDEGTLFSFTTLNVTTDAEFLDYVASNWFPRTPRAKLARLLELCPSDPATGSPFGTGDDNVFAPQFKRMAALQGDILFIAPRRLLTRTRVRAGGQAVYSFCKLANEHRVPGLGATHAMDLNDVFGAPGSGHLQDYLVRFVATLDPNGDGAFEWPRYTRDAPLLLTVNDGVPAITVNLTRDDFREEAMAYLTELTVAEPF